MLIFWLRGLLIGFSIAAPVGPIGVLCIRRTLAAGRVTGLVSGLGAATADSFYGAVAGFGLTFISGLLIDQRFWLRLIGGAFLCYLGIRTFLARARERPTGATTAVPGVAEPGSGPRGAAESAGTGFPQGPLPGGEAKRPPPQARPAEQAATVKSSGLAGAYASTLFLTLTNPTTILSFAAIFAGLGIANTSGNYLNAGLLVLGVFLGSALWWLTLSSVVSIFRAKIGSRQLQWVNRISGAVILAFGVLAFFSLLGG